MTQPQEPTAAAAPTEQLAYTPAPPGESPGEPVEVQTLESAAAPRKRRGRWVWPTLAGLSLAGMAALSAYLAVVAFQWSDQVDQLTEISTDLGATVTDAKSERDAAVAERDEMETQLEAAKARITELANEEANANDAESVLLDYVDAMRSCSDQRQQIIDVLTDGSLYFPGTTTKAVEAETTATCNQIAADFDAYKAELGQ